MPCTVILVPLSANWSPADDIGLPVDDLVASVKNAIKQANVSVTDPDRDLAVTSVYLRLNTIATATVGGGLDFRIPFIGMKVKVGATVTRQRTHVMEMTLVPELAVPEIQTRDAAVEGALVDAIEAVRAVMSRSAEGTTRSPCKTAQWSSHSESLRMAPSRSASTVS